MRNQALRVAAIVAATFATGCGAMRSTVTVQPARNISIGLAHAAVFSTDGACYGEFMARSGHIVRPKLPDDFCVAVATSAAQAAPATQRQASPDVPPSK